MDVQKALMKQNVLIPAGNAKMGDVDFQIFTNALPETVEALNDTPINVVHGAPVLMRHVGDVRDAGQIQSNVVRVNGERQVLYSDLSSAGRQYDRYRRCNQGPARSDSESTQGHEFRRPQDAKPGAQRRMDEWTELDVWQEIHEIFLARLRSADRLDWSRALVDSGLVKAPLGGDHLAGNGEQIEHPIGEPTPIDRLVMLSCSEALWRHKAEEKRQVLSQSPSFVRWLNVELYAINQRRAIPGQHFRDCLSGRSQEGGPQPGVFQRCASGHCGHRR